MSDTCQSVESSLPFQQRSHVRQRVLFSCIQLEDDNGGIILDASEGGLAIQTVRSLDGNEFLQMRFQFSQCRNWIESRGRIAWVSTSNKIAGIAFVDLSDEAREEIRTWIGLTGQARGPQIGKLATPETTSIRRAPIAYKLASSESSGAETLRQNVDVQSAQSKPDKEIARKKDPLVAVSSREAEEEIGSYGLRPVPAVRPNTIPSVKRVAMISVILALGLLGVFSFRYKQEGSRSLLRLADQARTHLRVWMRRGDISPRSMVRKFTQTMTSHVEAALPVTAATVAKPQTRNSVLPGAAHFLPDNRSSEPAGTMAAVAGNNLQPHPPAETAAAPGIAKSATEEPAGPARAVRQHAENGRAQLDLALQFLRKTDAPQDGAKARQLLWLAVQKGNGEAEVQLAGLYLRGQGMPKNCDQGHILLEAARLKQFVTAAEERSQLSQSGCD